MRTYHYHLVDVFTKRAFGGNQLAVFTDGRGLASEEMQAIAKEMNLSESTFVLPARDARSDFHVRIFTPALELPLAGHPTVGTAFVLARERMLGELKSEMTTTFEEGVGLISVTLKAQAGMLQSIAMRQPLPTFGPYFTDRAAIAQMLSLDERDFAEGLPLEVVSCGVPFLYAPVKSLAALRAVRFRRDVWERVLQNFVASQIFVFTQEVEVAGSATHCRMFAPAMGISEDPATGAAHGPLGSYLVRHKLIESVAGWSEFVSEQGFEMGRPSFLQVTIEQSGEDITAVYVGGQCYYMGAGHLELRDA
ncbi:MAG: PhzF family phenazine biosynthesis protein [Ktedonobacteraceae bacterium]